MNATTTHPQDDDDMPAEIDFSKGTRGKFYRANATLHVPVYLEADVQAYLTAIAAKKGVPLSRSRKTVILLGLVISCAILLCNYTDSQALIMLFMSIAFFGKGVAALGWAVMSDAAPREATGLSGSIFNLFGNAAGFFTPIGIGYILAATNNNWDMALVFVFAHSIVAMISYGFITGQIRRVVLKAA